MTPAKRAAAVSSGHRRAPAGAKASIRVEAAGVCDVPAPADNVSAADDDTLAAMAKALGHPVRVKIMRLLIARDACVTGDVVSTIGLAQSTVSEHLRLLRHAGLIQGEIEGPRTRYCVNRTGLQAFKAAIATL